MTFNQTSSIRFSVEESVWFKKGQEVSDLLAMSLDPEISVQEHADYISIRGALVLTGDYYPHAEEQADEQEINSLRETASFRTVDEVVESDAGVHSMKHRFPIDITIPTNRIQSLEDVYVLIETFDYEIPERGRLELKADLSISGIVNERETTQSSQPASETAAPTAQTDENKKEQTSSVRQDGDDSVTNSATNREERNVTETVGTKFPSFSTEVRKEVGREETVEEVSDVREEVKSVNHTEDVIGVEEVEEQKSDDKVGPQLELVPEPESRNEENDQEEVVLSEVETEENPEPETEESEREQEQEDIAVNIVSKNPSPQIGMKGRTEEQEQAWNPKSLYTLQQKTYSTNKSENNKDAMEQQELQQRSKRSENALYLTKMLASEGEEDFSKLRMRIVQNGETLGMIAETYDISPNQIIRLNGLEDDVIEEGQILYIPEYAKVE